MHQTITRAAALSRPAEPEAGRADAAAGEPRPAAASAGTRPVSARAAESVRSMAGVAVLFGAAGLFVFNVIFGPLAIGLGVAALRRHHASERTRALALIGAVLGVADLIVLAVLVALSFAAHGSVTWHFGA